MSCINNNNTNFVENISNELIKSKEQKENNINVILGLQNKQIDELKKTQQKKLNELKNRYDDIFDKLKHMSTTCSKLNNENIINKEKLKHFFCIEMDNNEKKEESEKKIIKKNCELKIQNVISMFKESINSINIKHDDIIISNATTLNEQNSQKNSKVNPIVSTGDLNTNVNNDINVDTNNTNNTTNTQIITPQNINHSKRKYDDSYEHCANYGSETSRKHNNNMTIYNTLDAFCEKKKEEIRGGKIYRNIRNCTICYRKEASNYGLNKTNFMCYTCRKSKKCNDCGAMTQKSYSNGSTICKKCISKYLINTHCQLCGEYCRTLPDKEIKKCKHCYEATRTIKNYN
jgi:hypothetical protein